MAVSTAKGIFHCDIQRVWKMMTATENFLWRSDLDRIEILSLHQFVEYTKEGYATTFTVTAWDPCKRWEFDMENDNMKGHWTGILTARGNTTEVDFIEDVTAKKLLMKPFVKAYLKKQQALYISDLTKALAAQTGK